MSKPLYRWEVGNAYDPTLVIQDVSDGYELGFDDPKRRVAPPGFVALVDAECDVIALVRADAAEVLLKLIEFAEEHYPYAEVVIDDTRP